jgi:beta-glucosidase
VRRLGGAQPLTFELVTRDLASFDTAASSWVAEAGQYTVKVGASSKDIKHTATFRLAGDTTVKTVSKALSPGREIDVMRP